MSRKKNFTILSAITTLSGNQILEFGRLVEEGFDINSDISGSRPVHEICRYGYEEFLRFLIEKGANLDLTDWDDRTPIVVCIEHERWECFKILVASQAKYGLEIKLWLQSSDPSPEVPEYINHLIQKLYWSKRKQIIYYYAFKNPRLPMTLFREIVFYL
jgi:ankyrin repeat protein